MPSRTISRVALTASGARLARAALLGSLLTSAACGIPLEDFAVGPVNACGSSVDCGAGAVCADVGTGTSCVATNASLKRLILEIRPAADSQLGASVSHLIVLADHGVELPFQEPTGHVHAFDPTLPVPVRVDGLLDASAVSYCDGQVSGGDFPLKISFRRVAPFPGLPEQEYTTTSEPGDRGQQKFQIDLPIGDYDIHLIPQPRTDCVEVPPPVFLQDQHVLQSTNLRIDGVAPEVLKGAVQVPHDVSVTGWSIDAVEPVTGRVISQVATLSQDPSRLYAEFLIKYYRSGADAFTPLIRLRPKDGDPRPTVYWDVSAVALQGSTSNIQLTLSKLDAVPRPMGGRTLDVRGDPVFSTIRIQSANANAVYKLETDTDANGAFRVDLPPGKYNLFARPINDMTRAKVTTAFKLPEGADCFCGQSITIPDSGAVLGGVRGPAGESIDGAEVFAVPATTDPKTYLDLVLGADPLLPRQASTTVLSDAFSFRADPGEFNFSVRPASGSVYPWLVLSRLGVSDVESTPVTDLGALAVSYPAVLDGVVRDATGAPLGDAMVRAWLPVEDPTGAVDGVIQIGETRAGPDGVYVLPLPPSISQ